MTAERIEVSCPLCRTGNAKTVFQNADITIVKCRSCSFMYQNPRSATPSEDEASKKDAYYEPYVGSDEARQHIARFKFDRYLADRPSGKALDIGCGLGEFLAVAQEKGWEAVGIDLSEWVCRHLAKRGFQNVIRGTLEDAHFGDAEFEAVYMSHVLEHIPQPLQFLQEVRRVLKPGGLVLIEVPNEGNFRLLYAVMNILRGRGAEKIGPFPEHLSLFSKTTLRETLKRAKFQLIDIHTEGYNTPGRVEFSVHCRSAGVRLAVFLSRMKIDVFLGLARHLVAAAQKM